MRIDIVTDTFAPDVNGVAMTLGRLTDGMRRRSHLVHVIRTGDKGAQQGQTAARAIALPGYQEIKLGLPSPFKLRKRWIKRRPDVVYVATESPLGGSAVKAAAKDARTRAENILQSAGNTTLGKLVSADMGIININPANSTATSSEGNNDKTSLEKDIITIVRAEFVVQ